MKWWIKTREFLSEVWVELKKTTWPSWKEVRGTTLVVIVMVIVCAAFLWGVDLVLQKPVELLYPH